MTNEPGFEDLKRRYFVGLAKTGDGADPQTLSQFALAAMHSRFQREPPPATRDSGRIALDVQPLLPDAARPLLLRLCATKAADHLASAAVQALTQAGVLLHPFDFHALEELVLRFSDRLGNTARAWAGKVRPLKAEPETAVDVATEETFAAASRVAKLTFLKQLRIVDPTQARDLVTQHFAGEPAAIRSDFLDVLSIGVGESDLEILTAAASDKAQSVRAKAAALLARVPGTEAYAARLAKLPDYIKMKTALLTRRKSLTIAGLGDPVATKLSELCDGLRLEDIARVLGLGVAEFVAASSEVAGLGDVVLKAVIAERRFALIESFQATLEDAGWLVGNILHEALPLATPSDREMLIRTCIVPQKWTKVPQAFVLERFHTALEGPLSAAQAEALMHSAAWTEMLGKDVTPALTAQFEALAPLIPRSLSIPFIAATGAIAPRAALFHQFVLALPETSAGRP
ncbi:MAG TPA: DUF5691 domain-containing protein [Rhizomicrobium sp.]|nr:DUF5691 domain-containing protein [Rhizomicrobium sp.]